MKYFFFFLNKTVVFIISLIINHIDGETIDDLGLKSTSRSSSERVVNLSIAVENISTSDISNLELGNTENKSYRRVLAISTTRVLFLFIDDYCRQLIMKNMTCPESIEAYRRPTNYFRIINTIINS